jgi:cobalamin biosynthesis protein CbiG
MVEKGLKYIDLSKEIVMNFIDFAQKINIKNLIMLLDRKNKDYVKILQSLMTVGFASEKGLASVKIGDVDYKVLKMTVSSNPQEVEEIAF